MGQAVRLALAGLRARRAASLAVLLLLVVALAGAVVAPVFLRAAAESAVRRELALGPAADRVVAVASGEASDEPGTVVAEARAELDRDPVLRGALGTAVAGSDARTRTEQGDVLPVVARDGLCAHLVLTEGRCPAAAGEVVLAGTLPVARLGEGVPVVPGGVLTVVGRYAPIDVQDPYWLGHGYDPADAVGDPRDPLRRLGAAFTVPATFPALVTAGGRERAVLDLPLRVDRVHAGDEGAVRAALEAFSARLLVAVPDASVTTQVPGRLAAAQRERAALRLPVVLLVGQLLVLALLVLVLVVDGTSTARRQEVALARLRGLGRARTLATGLLETALLVVLALPVALLVGLYATRVALAGRLTPGTPVVLTWPALLCAAGAVVAALLAAAWAARDVLRTPASELLRATPPRRRRGTALLVAVVVLAVLGGLQLARAGAPGDGPDLVALAAPGALALAVALLGERLLPVAGRLLGPVTRLRGPLAGFLAVRSLARRPSGARCVVVVGTAFGLAAFAASSWSVTTQDRHDRALADTGAATAYEVRVDSGTDLQQAVRAAAPDGSAMAVVRYDSPGSSPGTRRLLAVDSSRLAEVAFWRRDLAPGSAAALAARLSPPAAAPVLLQGTEVELTATVADRTPPRDPAATYPPPDPPSLSLELDGAAGERTRVDLGPVPAVPGPLRLRAPLTGCDARPCRLRALRVTRVLAAAPVQVELTVSGLAVRRGGSSTDLSPALAVPGRWRTDQTVGSAPTGGPAGLTVALSGAAGQQPGLVVADGPEALPALVTGTAFRASGALRVPALDARDHPGEQVAVTPFVPGAGDDAALADLTLADRATVGPRSELLTSAVWASPSAPADLPARLSAAGVHVLSTSTAAGRQADLARQGPALVVRLLLAAGVTATLLASGGAAVSLALLGRRRQYELAALRAAGVRERSLTASVLLEQGVLLATGAVLGLAAGLVGGRLAVGSLPTFEGAAVGLPLLAGPRPGTLGLVLVAAVAAGVAPALLAGLVLLRHGSSGGTAQRLREAQA